MRARARGRPLQLRSGLNEGRLPRAAAGEASLTFLAERLSVRPEETAWLIRLEVVTALAGASVSGGPPVPAPAVVFQSETSSASCTDVRIETQASPVCSMFAAGDVATLLEN